MKLPWNKANSDLEREVAYHIETLADSFEAQGMRRDEALLRARREFGGVDQVKEQCRAESRWNWAVQAIQDLSFGWRMIRKSPSISIAAVASLALGIGATTAIYSFADAVLWRKLAVPAPEQMVEVYWDSRAHPGALIQGASGSAFPEGGMRVADFFSKAAFESMRDRAAGKAEVAAHVYHQPVSISYRGKVTVSKLRAVTGNFFSVLRLQPFAGQLFRNGGRNRELLVTYRFWERTLGQSHDALGATMLVNNLAYTIVGVLPRDYFGLVPGDQADLYAPVWQSPSLLAADSWYRERSEDPYVWWLQLVARRAEGVSNDEAQAVLNTAFAGSWAVQPQSAEQTPRIRLVDASAGLGGVRRQLGDPVWILLGLVVLVLLIACANIANLLLARAAQREREVALRVSLGCSAGRLMRQFFTESLLLAILGGALSIGVALGIGSLMSEVLPQGLTAESLMVDLNSRSVLATGAVTLLTALLFGLYPAFRASRQDAAPSLREGAGTAGSMSQARLVPARILVLSQVALGVLLVTAAIIYTGHLSDLLGRDTGFDRAHTLMFDLRPGELGYQDERLESFYRNAEDRLKAIPGVVEVGISRTRPMRGGGFSDNVSTPDKTKSVNSAIHHATASFAAALGVPLVAGRAFTAEEVRAQRRVAIVSERLARDLNLSSPVGARILTPDAEWDVVGVAKNASYYRLTDDSPVLYVPLTEGTGSVTVLLRTAVAPSSILSAAREAIGSLDRNIPLVDVYTMEQQVARTHQRERMFAWLCGSFGVLALVLCTVGLYGLMSHSTARRTSEIGIRMALGATGRQVMRQVVSEGMRLTVAGGLLGVPLAIYGAKFAQAQKMLPDGPLPYWTLSAAVGVLVVSALAAVFGPALRASSVDPMRALRQG